VASPARRAGARTGLPPARDPQALSWLLRRAVRRYAAPVAEALAGAGLADLPQRGVWAVSALAESKPGLSGRDLVARMGISKQAVSQLVESLVVLGYVARLPAPGDRRRTLLRLTARGRNAARIIDDTVARAEAGMADTIGPERLHQLHRALIELDEA
jgi:MarR family transcriptional regulator, lower aerobic nicotinate degradation pathway regulator